MAKAKHPSHVARGKAMAAKAKEIRINSDTGQQFPACGNLYKKIRGKTRAMMAREKDEKYLSSLASIDDLRRAIAMLLHPDNDDASLTIAEEMRKNPEFKERCLWTYVESQARRQPMPMDIDEKELRKLEIEVAKSAAESGVNSGNQAIFMLPTGDSGMIHPSKLIENTEVDLPALSGPDGIIDQEGAEQDGHWDSLDDEEED